MDLTQLYYREDFWTDTEPQSELTLDLYLEILRPYRFFREEKPNWKKEGF